MNCGPRGKCEKAYRKPGRDTVHCEIQTEKGGKWDFCAHQYFCQRTQKYELSREANECPMLKKEAEKTVSKPKKTAEKKTKQEG